MPIPDVITDGNCQEYIDLYQPKAYQIEELVYDYQPLQTMRPHFTSRYKANQLRKKYEQENGFHYDVIICGRPDVKLLSPFKKEYLQEFNENTIGIHHFKDGIPADYFFYAAPHWMDVTADCYHEMHLLNQYQPGSERLWWYKLQKEGYQYKDFVLFGNSVHDAEHRERSRNYFDIACIR